MGNFGIVEIIIIVANVLVSFKGFNDRSFFNSWTFEVDKVLKNKEYYRLVTSGFLHVSGNHLLFNMLTLYFFAGNIENYLGSIPFLIIYMGSLIGGNLFSLFIHYRNDLYRAVGASGAVSGVVFAAIALFPGMKLAFIFVPIPFPAWIYGVGFVIYSIYGIRAQRDNIGHEAHLGGAIIGLLITIAYVPVVLMTNLTAILLILIPSVIFVFIIIYKPEFLLIDKKYAAFRGNADDQYLNRKAEEQEDLDYLLEKINRYGMESLTPGERERLEKYSDKR